MVFNYYSTLINLPKKGATANQHLFRGSFSTMVQIIWEGGVLKSQKERGRNRKTALQKN